MPVREFHYKKGFTHNGLFHADDVFSAAFLRLLRPEIEFERGSSVPADFDGIVFDIGVGEFDHHQSDNASRPDGTPYAAFGKLWKAFAPGRYPQAVVQQMDDCFIRHLDAADNGVECNLLSEAVHTMNPAWNSQRKEAEAFEEAVDIAGRILSCRIESCCAELEAVTKVQEAILRAENGILQMDRYYPWEKTVQNVPDIQFVIFPSARGGYSVLTVPVDGVTGTRRVGFPERWLGNPDKELGMIFCHPANFIAVTNTREQAVQVAQIAIRESGREETK